MNKNAAAVSKGLIPLLLLMMMLPLAGHTQYFPGNTDERKVPQYTLPDPLLLPNGKKLSTRQQWISVQRPRMLQLFKDHVYGQLPAAQQLMKAERLMADSQALDGIAIRTQVRLRFGKGAASSFIDLLIYQPRVRRRPAVFVGLNFKGNHCLEKDTQIQVPGSWLPERYRNTDSMRGVDASRWPLKELISGGYALVTAYYGDLEPDHPEGWKEGIRGKLKDALKLEPEQWGAIGAWAWGLSRIMDYIESDTSLDAGKVAITGHSRLGKAALWAAANDERFALVVANNSGEGGAALSRRLYGETIEALNATFPHWFSRKYREYNGNAHALPVDQHILLSLIAPRPLYVASAVEDSWADPKGEYLAAVHAGPVYALFGKKGLKADEMPAIDKPAGQTVRYHIRKGGHDMNHYDWQQYLKFAGEQFGKR